MSNPDPHRPITDADLVALLGDRMEGETADAIIGSINDAAASIGAPPVFLPVRGSLGNVVGYQMHPELLALVQPDD